MKQRSVKKQTCKSNKKNEETDLQKLKAGMIQEERRLGLFGFMAYQPL